VTVAELTVVFTAIGLNVNPVNTGGCVSWPRAGIAAKAARNSRNKVQADFSAKLQLLRADIADASNGASTSGKRWRRR
jgi:hypothetical protein